MLQTAKDIYYTSTKKGVCCMSGSYWKQGKRWFVGWYYDDYSHGYKRRVQAKVGYYRSLKMFDKSIAVKCLSTIQARYEDSLQGLCQFRIEEFTGKGWTDVNEFYEEWMNEVIEPKRKPATIKGYWSYYRNWIEPFFKRHPVKFCKINKEII